MSKPTSTGSVSNTLLCTTECRYCHEFGHTVSRCSNILNTNTTDTPTYKETDSGSNRRYMKPQYTRIAKYSGDEVEGIRGNSREHSSSEFDSSDVYMLYVGSEQDRSDIKEMNDRIGKLKGKSWADDE